MNGRQGSLEGPLSPDFALQQQEGSSFFGEIRAADLRRFALFLPAYWVAYRYGLQFTEVSAAPFWSPDAVLLCWLLASPMKQWWVYLIACLPIRLSLAGAAAPPLWFLLATYLNDTLKGLLAAYVLRRFLGFPVRILTLRAFTIFVATASIAVPFLSALAGAATRHALGYRYWQAWYEWFLGDMLASLIITPTLLYWFVSGRPEKRRFAALALLCLGLAVTLYYAFIVTNPLPSHLLLCVPFPFLIWAVIRTGPVGTSAALSLVSLVSIVSTARGNGIFSYASPAQASLAIQLFLLVTAVPLLFLAVVMEERRAIQEDLKRSRQMVSSHYERIRKLAGRLIHAQEDERRRISLELHDDFGQRLALLQVRLTGLRQSLPHEMQAQCVLLEDAINDVNDTTQGIRNLSHELHSSTLHLLGLRVALTKLCQQTSEEYGIAVRVDMAADLVLSHDAKLCLYRVAQEALNNAVRHGRAENIVIELQSNNGFADMRIKDSGIGFDPATTSDGLGLVSMRERVNMLDGELTVKSQPHAGTEIMVRLCVAPSQTSQAAS